MVDQTKYPILHFLCSVGAVYIENLGYGVYAWVGRAADGEIVGLGNNEDDTELYLKTHPTPNHW